jgi:hypothetical protein
MGRWDGRHESIKESRLDDPALNPLRLELFPPPFPVAFLAAVEDRGDEIELAEHLAPQASPLQKFVESSESEADWLAVMQAHSQRHESASCTADATPSRGGISNPPGW